MELEQSDMLYIVIQFVIFRPTWLVGSSRAVSSVAHRSSSGNSSTIQVVEARDRGFQVHVLLTMDQSRLGHQ